MMRPIGVLLAALVLASCSSPTSPSTPPPTEGRFTAGTWQGRFTGTGNGSVSGTMTLVLEQEGNGAVSGTGTLDFTAATGGRIQVSGAVSGSGPLVLPRVTTDSEGGTTTDDEDPFDFRIRTAEDSPCALVTFSESTISANHRIEGSFSITGYASVERGTPTTTEPANPFAVADQPCLAALLLTNSDFSLQRQ
jgi:hypothetical protein